MRTAMSQPPSSRSTWLSVRPSSTFTAGWRRLNSGISGAMNCVPKVKGTFIRSSPVASTRWEATLASASSISGRMRWQASR